METGGGAHTSEAGGALWVDVPGFQGPLEKLVVSAQRGEVDVAALPVGEITSAFRRRVERADPPPALSEIAEFLTLASRLVTLKAAALLPEATTAPAEEEGDPEVEGDGGRRLAEYRLYRAAVDGLLSDGEEGYRSFLGAVTPDVTPLERLRVPPERLVAALRNVLERLSTDEPLPLGVVTFSVVEIVGRLRERLSGGASITFDEVFAHVGSRLEAVAYFLALLELLSRGEADVTQRETFGPIVITGRG